MALNPFFLQGSFGEQRLVQELINEQLKIYGVEVTYIPRKYVRKQTIIEEVQSSKFDEARILVGKPPIPIHRALKAIWPGAARARIRLKSDAGAGLGNSP